MPDMSMCRNKACNIRGTCYRYLAEPNPNWQSYSSFLFDDDGFSKRHTCRDHEKVLPGDRVRKLAIADAVEFGAE